MPTWVRYLLFQIPGWVAAAVVLFALWRWWLLPEWLALAGFSFWVLKDFLLYPLLRTAYERRARSGSSELVGKTGVAAGDLAPEGFVRVQGELWRAVANPTDRTIPSGTPVEVLAAEGMRLSVRPITKDG